MSITECRQIYGPPSLPRNHTLGARWDIRDSCKKAFHISGLGDSLEVLEAQLCALN